MSDVQVEEPEEVTELEAYMEALRESLVPGALETFAASAGTSVAYLWQIARRKRAPGTRTMFGIHRASRGAVSYRSLVESSPALDNPSRVGISTVLEAKRRRRAAKAAAKAREEAVA